MAPATGSMYVLTTQTAVPDTELRAQDDAPGDALRTTLRRRAQDDAQDDAPETLHEPYPNLERSGRRSLTRSMNLPETSSARDDAP